MPRRESSGRSGGRRKPTPDSGRRRNTRSKSSSRFSEERERKGEERYGKRPLKRPSRFSDESKSGKRFIKKRSDGEKENKGQPSFNKKSTYRKSAFDEPAKKPYTKRYTKKDQSSGEKRGFFNKQKFRQHDSGKQDGKRNELPASSGKTRLNKFIANSGVCSRREADNLITMGLISVNGKVITELGYKINPGDEVRYESKVLRAERPVYILLNKPKGFLTTTSDPQERNTVMHIIGNAVKERVYPVGRLDRNTTGLLLLTNDGDLAEKLSHPSHNAKKIYKVEIDKALTKADFQKILDGVELEEGRAMVDDLAIVSPDGKTIGLELHIGWNRVVRRIFEALGYQVVKLDRTVYAGLDKKDLPRGEWRFLKPDEIIRLKHY